MLVAQPRHLDAAPALPGARRILFLGSKFMDEIIPDILQLIWH